MFVFWYCHKRGKQVRLDREIEEGKAGEAGGAAAADSKEEFDGSDFDATDSDGGEEADSEIAEQIATAVKEDRETEDEHAAALKRKEEALNKP
jgi:hypothetical protein